MIHFSFVMKNNFTSNTEIKWLNIEEAQKLNKKVPKKIFIDVYTSWCGWCKVMDKKTFTDPKVVEYMNKKFYSVKLDAESPKQITFGGQKMTESELAGRFFGVTSFPTTLYLDESLQGIHKQPGFLEVADFYKLVEIIGENKYKDKP